MNFDQLSSQNLRKAIALTEAREAHQAAVAEINHSLEALFAGESVGSELKPTIPKTTRRHKRGEVKEGIIKLLQKAGAEGMPLQKMAEHVGLTSTRLNNWLFVNRGKIKGIQRIGRGQYAWVERAKK